jgi:lysozyme
MTPSSACVNLVKEFEGCRLGAYQDVRGIWTIGYGHTGESVVAGMIITPGQATAFLESDLTRASASVDALITMPLSQDQYDALVSFEFNTGALKGSTLQRLLNGGQYALAADQFLAWNKSTIDGQLVVVPGLTRRRQAERALFLGVTSS